MNEPDDVMMDLCTWARKRTASAIRLLRAVAAVVLGVEEELLFVLGLVSLRERILGGHSHCLESSSAAWRRYEM